MATYRDIATTEHDPQAPITAALMKALDANVDAVAEGATGAPLVAAGWHAYNRTIVSGTETGLFYDFAVNGATNIFVTPDFVDGYEYRVRFESFSGTALANFNLELFLETGGVYSAGLIGIGGAQLAAASLYSGLVEFSSVRRTTVVHPLTGFIVTHSVANAFNAHTNVATSYLAASAQKITRARFSLAAGVSDAGRFYLDRRLAMY